jgi:hypothetical protein
MSNPMPINLPEPATRASSSSAQMAKRLVIVALATLTVTTAIAWCGLIGWGIVEALRLAATGVYRLWAASL